jgi:MOSC domain-containing protein YiiM
VTLLQRPHDGFTVDRVLAARYVQPRSRAEVEAIAALAALAPEWRTQFAKLPAKS